jgi:hypothetical protein
MNLKSNILIAIFVFISSGEPYHNSFGSVSDSNQKDLANERVVYRIPDMDKVAVRLDVKYKTINDTELTMDLYYPPNLEISSRLPVVIFVNGFSDEVIQKRGGSKLKDMGQYKSWGKLTAASGLIGIAYETVQPDADIDSVIDYIRKNGSSLNIDADRMGMWACSGNVPTALSVIKQESREYLRCAVLYYGYMLTGDQKYQAQIDSMAQKYGFYPGGLKDVEHLHHDVPLFIVRVGLDRNPNLNQTIDHFIHEAISRNDSIIFINYNDGRHAFDMNDDNDKSREIIKQTLEFTKTHLLFQ